VQTNGQKIVPIDKVVMRVHIIGMGIVGSYATLKMAREGHIITVFEPSLKRPDVIYGAHFPTAHIEEIMSLLSTTELDGLKTEFEIVYMCNETELLRIHSHESKSTLIPQQTLTETMREMCRTMETVSIIEQRVATVDAEKSRLVLKDGTVHSFEIAIVCTGARSDLKRQLDATSIVRHLSKWRVHDLYGEDIGVQTPHMTWDISSRPSMTVSFGKDHLRYEYLVTSDHDSHETKRTLPVSPSRIKDHQVRTYTVTSTRCKQYHKKSVLFAGDFAHTVEPFLGIGISEGLHDINFIASALCAKHPLRTLGNDYTKYVRRRLFQTHLKTRVLYLAIHMAHFTGSNHLSLALGRTVGRCLQRCLQPGARHSHACERPDALGLESLPLYQARDGVAE
jgi:2-polyprenyl-6-methoxyphenol hydroxylase-like FAD-dependent oxidoreductase